MHPDVDSSCISCVMVIFYIFLVMLCGVGLELHHCLYPGMS